MLLEGAPQTLAVKVTSLRVRVVTSWGACSCGDLTEGEGCPHPAVFSVLRYLCPGLSWSRGIGFNELLGCRRRTLRSAGPCDSFILSLIHYTPDKMDVNCFLGAEGTE